MASGQIPTAMTCRAAVQCDKAAPGLVLRNSHCSRQVEANVPESRLKDTLLSGQLLRNK